MNAFNKLTVAIFLIVITLGSKAYAFEKSSCSNDLNELAIELLHMDLNGARMSDEEISACSFQKIKSTMIRQIQEVPNEEYGLKFGLESSDKFIIKNVKAIDEKQYLVSFIVDRNGKKMFADQFVMLRHQSNKKISKYGCAEFLSFPDRIFTHSQCL